MRSICVIALNLLAWSAFCTLRFPKEFVNWDHPEVEKFFQTKNLSRIYLDGARPYFVQRSSPDSVLFYDLNSRLRGKFSEEALCPIAQCFQPNYWVITQHQKSKAEFAHLRSYFNGIVLETDQAFVATNFAGHCQNTNTLTECKNLTMMK